MIYFLIIIISYYIRKGKTRDWSADPGFCVSKLCF